MARLPREASDPPVQPAGIRSSAPAEPASRVRRGVDSAQQLQQQRDDALIALLNTEQKAAFEKISKEYADRYAELLRQRDDEFAQAVNETRKLLDDQQRQKYDQILKSHVGEQTLRHVSPTKSPD